MGQYANVKSKNMRRFLKWLENKGVEVIEGRHTKVKITHNSKVFTVPTSHPEVNKYIVKDFRKFLIDNDICTKEEFDDKL